MESCMPSGPLTNPAVVRRRMPASVTGVHRKEPPCVLVVDEIVAPHNRPDTWPPTFRSRERRTGCLTVDYRWASRAKLRLRHEAPPVVLLSPVWRLRGASTQSFG